MHRSLKRKNSKVYFCEAIADNFLSKFSNKQINPNKQAIFIVPPISVQQSDKYKKFLQTINYPSAIDDNFFSFMVNDPNILSNIFMLVLDSMYSMDKDTHSIFTFVPSSKELFGMAKKFLCDSGYDLLVVDATNTFNDKNLNIIRV